MCGRNVVSGRIKSPEVTETLIDSLVETDEATGQTYLKIPVADKQVVRNMLELLGKMLRN